MTKKGQKAKKQTPNSQTENSFNELINSEVKDGQDLESKSALPTDNLGSPHNNEGSRGPEAYESQSEEKGKTSESQGAAQQDPLQEHFLQHS